MKKSIVTTLSAFAVALALAFTGGSAVAADGGLQSLRGDNLLAAPDIAADIPNQLTPPKFERTFEHQPPLITHRIDRYQVDLNQNRCLRCHDKATYKDEDAPLTGKSHYLDKDGKEQKTINMSRYFCTQCHVPQLDAKPLVDNKFQGVVK